MVYTGTVIRASAFLCVVAASGTLADNPSSRWKDASDALGKKIELADILDAGLDNVLLSPQMPDKSAEGSGVIYHKKSGNDHEKISRRFLQEEEEFLIGEYEGTPSSSMAPSPSPTSSGPDGSRGFGDFTGAPTSSPTSTTGRGIDIMTGSPTSISRGEVGSLSPTASPTAVVDNADRGGTFEDDDGNQDGEEAEASAATRSWSGVTFGGGVFGSMGGSAVNFAGAFVVVVAAMGATTFGF